MSFCPFFMHKEACLLSHFSSVWLFATQWTVARQAPLSMGFSRQEYWSGLPCPPPGELPDPGIKPESLMSPALAGGFFTTSTTWEAPTRGRECNNYPWRSFMSLRQVFCILESTVWRLSVLGCACVSQCVHVYAQKPSCVSLYVSLRVYVCLCS